MSARAVMVLGTTSGAGKSWLTTALCRWYARQGLKVAPFKAQNMSNNARVVPGLQGRMGEIGSAQYFQALAAGARPDVRMNPVLLKPEKDTASQVVVMGEVRSDLQSVPWRERSEHLWPYAQAGLRALMADHDVVVIEGAGSPAEINLHSSDYVNMRTALEAQAACLLVTDIDRGGAFAHLFGTHQLLPAHERALIKGFVLNRFRGDASLLAPGPQQLQDLTGVPTMAVLPMWRGHGLPEEDGVFDDAATGPSARFDAQGQRILRVAVLAYPRISNLDEFQPLRSAAHVRLVWARQASDLEGADWVVLPGSKYTTSDLAWLRAQGLDRAIAAHAQKGGAVLGICGGLQMLGQYLADPDGVESEAAQVPGLGLLDVQTRFDADKLLRDTSAQFVPHMQGAWSSLSGVSTSGYEIHHGRTQAVSAQAQPVLLDANGQVLGWQQGSVIGLYLHGLFESEPVLRALLGGQVPVLSQVFEGLADYLDQHFEPGALMALLAQPASSSSHP
ncbi:MAG: cobyric acid synthase [Aquabacterium sp.]|uniref:cobyric acid synthase n=1 Tax=Aquabacterium sp. TaxID=1872578 RepID=UPI001217930D|nr:cobyric acid synthase [Aquabacterium sp.]TAK99923.1 MAG: cobyric acid synthase [Aquabacterium sp.]